MSKVTAENGFESISTSIEVDELDTNLFRSRNLRLPFGARGVFGGQVISQALFAATKSVESAFGLHSLHCYFLLSAAHDIPILYYVERVRNGRSYVTRVVKAVQRGRAVFVMMCSFQKPEPLQPQFQWKMPSVPSPETCELEEDRLRRRAAQSMHIPEAYRFLLHLAEERARSPVYVRIARAHEEMTDDGMVRYMYWMRAKDVPVACGAMYQKCVLGYMSDLHLLPVAWRTMGMERGERGPNTISMSSTLDHSIYYYSDNFDCGEWMLYVMTCPRTGSGRGVVHGQVYTRDGCLVAVLSQEGVVRAATREPDSKPKL
ncbi:Thioesterase/thiol ester dehydrase-isomerase [Fistulina hepatica ATCC 64428]|uniref:Thioesterase/thiol ester dehydrase-isomerase n=1 Tax=Fistulina hepatica ATCC 64428 TaxID=1128425 RepID=A0A0D7ANQ9_9AGAR|nr:Thioesterase/thiol ester dehydrase-isomerase [Fistulina hepatica ATCC 64428]